MLHAYLDIWCVSQVKLSILIHIFVSYYLMHLLDWDHTDLTVTTLCTMKWFSKVCVTYPLSVICMYVRMEQNLVFDMLWRGSVYVDPQGGWHTICLCMLQKGLKEDVDAVYLCGFSNRDTCTWSEQRNMFRKFRLSKFAGAWCHTDSRFTDQLDYSCKMVRDCCTTVDRKWLSVELKIVWKDSGKQTSKLHSQHSERI